MWLALSLVWLQSWGHRHEKGTALALRKHTNAEEGERAFECYCHADYLAGRSMVYCGSRWEGFPETLVGKDSVLGARIVFAEGFLRSM